MKRVAPLVVALGLAALAACGGGDDSAGAGAAGAGGGTAGAGGKKPVAEPFIALERDFQGFSTWKSFDLGFQPGDVDLGEPPGTRTIFANQLPEGGMAKFPIGTIFVKKIVGEVPENDRVFGMVKRGAGYNAIGAVGWEWFELSLDAEGKVTILWRGVAPPPGMGYGTSLNGSCNICHGTFEANDFVQTPQLKLTP